MLQKKMNIAALFQYEIGGPFAYEKWAIKYLP